MIRVIGLGIGEFVHIYGETEDPQYEIAEDYVDLGEELHLAGGMLCKSLRLLRRITRQLVSVQ